MDEHGPGGSGPAAPAAPAPHSSAPLDEAAWGGDWDVPAPTAATTPTTPAAVSTPAAAPSASVAEVAALRARLAELESAIAEVRAAAPPPVLRRAPLVLVGPSGSGKTTLALRLAQSPALTRAERPAVLIVAPEADRFVDPASVFWGAGVPVAVASTPDEVAEAVQTFADADLLIVDTPSLPLSPERARPVVGRLGEMLAPLGDVEVHVVVDATRARATLSAGTFAALGLTPDALALARLDEAPADAAGWADHLGLALRFTSSGPDLADIDDTLLTRPAPAAFAVETSPRPRTLTDPLRAAPAASRPGAPQTAFTHVPVLA